MQFSNHCLNHQGLFIFNVIMPSELQTVFTLLALELVNRNTHHLCSHLGLRIVIRQSSCSLEGPCGFCVERHLPPL